MSAKKYEGGAEGGGSKKRLRPPDGGWGWMVAIGCFFCIGLLSMISLCYSIIFSRFLLERNVSTTTTNWILNLHLFFHNLIGIIIGPLKNELGFRKVSLIGAVFTCLCFLSLVFVNSTWYLLVFYSGSGIFVGLAIKPCFLLIAVYFDRRRGLANAFLMAGICTGQFAGPPLIRYLLDEYSLHGAVLILAGMFLNSIVGISLFQPVEWHLKSVEDEEVDVELRARNDTQFEDNDKIGDEIDELKNSERARLRELGRKNMLSKHMKPRRISDSSSLSLSVSQIDLSSVPSTSKIFRDDVTDLESEAAFTSSNTSGIHRMLKAVLRVANSVLSDLKILRSLRAIIIVIGGITTIIAYINFIVMVPFSMQNMDYTLSDAAWCVSIAGMVNFIARLTTSTLSDCRWFNMRLAYMTGATIMSVTMIAFGFLTDLTWMRVMMGVWGYGLGMTVSLYVLIMAKYMGLEKMPAIFGVQSLCMAIAFITIGPLIGVIRDASDSYKVAMVACGVLSSLCVLMWSLMPAAVEWDRRRDEKQRTKEEESKKMEKLTRGLVM